MVVLAVVGFEEGRGEGAEDDGRGFGEDGGRGGAQAEVDEVDKDGDEDEVEGGEDGLAGEKVLPLLLARVLLGLWRGGELITLRLRGEGRMY